jgi:hypothetical protein
MVSFLKLDAFEVLSSIVRFFFFVIFWRLFLSLLFLFLGVVFEFGLFRNLFRGRVDLIIPVFWINFYGTHVLGFIFEFLDHVVELGDALTVVYRFDVTVLIELTFHDKKEFTAAAVFYFFHLLMVKPAVFSFTRFVDQIVDAKSPECFGVTLVDNGFLAPDRHIEVVCLDLGLKRVMKWFCLLSSRGSDFIYLFGISLRDHVKFSLNFFNFVSDVF